MKITRKIHWCARASPLSCFKSCGEEKCLWKCRWVSDLTGSQGPGVKPPAMRHWGNKSGYWKFNCLHVWARMTKKSSFILMLFFWATTDYMFRNGRDIKELKDWFFLSRKQKSTPQQKSFSIFSPYWKSDSSLFIDNTLLVKQKSSH